MQSKTPRIKTQSHIKEGKFDYDHANFVYLFRGLAFENPDSSGAMGDIVKQAKTQSAAGGDKDRPDGVTDLTIVLWRNGFQVNSDGEFRNKDDPANAKFVEELKEGVVPTELRQKYPKGLSVSLEDKIQQDYVPPPPPKYISFSGAGTSLGGGAAAAATNAVVDTKATGGKPVVDESKEKTQLQFRFHNGERASIEVNLTHTVGDLHAYIMTVAPVDGEYKLLSGFPPKPLTDPSATIQSAGL